MKLGSLFDGSGGFPLSGFLCGIEPIWASEVEPYPIAVTKSRFPHMKHLGDINKINGAEIEPVDIITFGSPCQDLSVAGKRAGLKHENNGDDETTRSGLFMEAVRIIKEMREKTNGEYPKFAVWENVPGAFSSNKGEDFKVVLEELIKIAAPSAVMPEVPRFGWAYADSYCGDGWSLAYRVLDAQYWGVPQRRRRIYLVADFRGQCAREILFEREGVRGCFAKGRTPWEAAPADAERGVGADDCARKISYTLKIRSGCEGGGKGALIQKNKSATLATNNDQYLFQPIIDSYVLDDQGCQQIHVRTDGKAPTLRAETHGNLPCIMEPRGTLEPDISCYDARGNGDGKTVNTITGDHENRITDYTSVVISKETIAIEGNGQRPSHRGDGYLLTDKSYTLNATEQHGVVYAVDQGGGKSSVVIRGNQAPTLTCTNDGSPAVAYQDKIGALYAGDSKIGNQYVGQNKLIVEPYEANNRYIVRRLTPTECARLQGFADRWGDIDAKQKFTDEEYHFWLEVRNTHAEINGRKTKEYTKAQMLTWYNKLHVDGSEYKMWGNGIALPTALYVMQGIKEASNESY
ncbi:MAG: DNA cytosine methyltransferase [Clostridia bacterium]|nr:DNA cytosine methyltransferase [Clostridia bacterium]